MSRRKKPKSEVAKVIQLRPATGPRGLVTIEHEEDWLLRGRFYAPGETAGHKDAKLTAACLFLPTAEGIAGLEAVLQAARERLASKGGAS